MDTALQNEVEQLVSDLAAGRFDTIGADGRAGRLTAAELRRAVEEYGKALVPLPAEAWGLVELYPTSDGGRVALDVPLWTAEEGRSDLTLSLSAVRSGTRFQISIDDLHVL